MSPIARKPVPTQRTTTPYDPHHTKAGTDNVPASSSNSATSTAHGTEGSPAVSDPLSNSRRSFELGLGGVTGSSPTTGYRGRSGLTPIASSPPSRPRPSVGNPAPGSD